MIPVDWLGRHLACKRQNYHFHQFKYAFISIIWSSDEKSGHVHVKCGRFINYSFRLADNILLIEFVYRLLSLRQTIHQWTLTRIVHRIAFVET